MIPNVQNPRVFTGTGALGAWQGQIAALQAIVTTYHTTMQLIVDILKTLCMGALIFFGSITAGLGAAAIYQILR
jgi:hypothetical protein